MGLRSILTKIKVQVCLCVCVCKSEREKEREREMVKREYTSTELISMGACMFSSLLVSLCM